MLTVHHLRRSQSERIVWLCEELGLDYELKCYERNPSDMLAPPAYKALHPMGIAPVVTDGDLVLGESGAIVDYILARHGPGGLVRGAGDPDFASLPVLAALRQRHAAADHGPQHDRAPHRPARRPPGGGVDAQPARTGAGAGREALQRSALPGRRGFQRGRHHERVLADHDAHLLPAGPGAVPADPGLAARAHRHPGAPIGARWRRATPNWRRCWTERRFSAAAAGGRRRARPGRRAASAPSPVPESRGCCPRRARRPAARAGSPPRCC